MPRQVRLPRVSGNAVDKAYMDRFVRATELELVRSTGGLGRDAIVQIIDNEIPEIERVPTTGEGYLNRDDMGNVAFEPVTVDALSIEDAVLTVGDNVGLEAFNFRTDNPSFGDNIFISTVKYTFPTISNPNFDNRSSSTQAVAIVYYDGVEVGRIDIQGRMFFFNWPTTNNHGNWGTVSIPNVGTVLLRSGANVRESFIVVTGFPINSRWESVPGSLDNSLFKVVMLPFPTIIEHSKVQNTNHVVADADREYLISIAETAGGEPDASMIFSSTALRALTATTVNTAAADLDETNSIKSTYAKNDKFFKLVVARDASFNLLVAIEGWTGLEYQTVNYTAKYIPNASGIGDFINIKRFPELPELTGEADTQSKNLVTNVSGSDYILEDKPSVNPGTVEKILTLNSGAVQLGIRTSSQYIGLNTTTNPMPEASEINDNDIFKVVVHWIVRQNSNFAPDIDDIAFGPYSRIESSFTGKEWKETTGSGVLLQANFFGVAADGTTNGLCVFEWEKLIGTHNVASRDFAIGKQGSRNFIGGVLSLSSRASPPIRYKFKVDIWRTIVP